MVVRPNLVRFAAAIVLAALFALPGAVQPATAAEQTVTVFAAASTKPALDALVPAAQSEGLSLRLVYAASSALARQIMAGAPADLYVSANAAWMDEVERKGLLAAATRTVIATNRLALIAPAPPGSLHAAAPPEIGRGFALSARLQGGRLAIADPGHVPAGIYARQSLTALGLWSEIQERLARARDVTGALMLVARGEAPLGVVYASDAARAPNVTVVGLLPTASHDAIVYPAAILRGRDIPAVRRAFALLSGLQGRAAFQSAGFGAAP